MRAVGERVEVHGIPASVDHGGYLKERTLSSAGEMTPQITEQGGNKGVTSVV